MNTLRTTEPDSDPALQRLIVEARGDLPRDLLAPERAVGLVLAAAFLAVAITMAALLDSGRGLDPPLAVALVGAFALAARIEFQTGSVWTDPTQLVFVGMLFLLPTQLAPLFVAAGLLLARLPEYRTGAVHVGRAVLRIADAWYSVGPAAVLIAAGAASPDLAQWPVYLAALGAQFACDLIPQSIRSVIGLGIPLRGLLDELRAIYLIDAMLASIGLLAALAAQGQEFAFLLVLPLLGLIAVFARERRARIENALTLSAAYRGTAHLLGELLSSTHEYTGSHSRSVVVLAHQVGVALEVDDEVLQEIEFGALLHDVGKMAVPNQIINKPGPLSDEEWAVMRTHTLRGEQMLERIGGVLGEVGAVVRNHHERYDGSGYPDRLRGEEIPLAARVIACCDAFQAMTSHRPYRRAMTIAEAVGELRAEAGRQFDPRVVGALVEIVAGWNGHPGRDALAATADAEPASAPA